MARPVTRPARRREIIAAALAEMDETGSVHIGVTDVARRMGLTGNAIRYYYKDNLSLLTAVRESVERRFIDDRQHVLESIEDVPARLVRAMELGLPAGPDDVEWRVTSSPLMAFGSDAGFGEVISEVFHKQQQLYRDILTEGVERGAFTLVDVDDVATTILAMEDYLGLRVVLRDPRFSRAEALRLMRAYAELATGAKLPVAS